MKRKPKMLKPTQWQENSPFFKHGISQQTAEHKRRRRLDEFSCAHLLNMQVGQTFWLASRDDIRIFKLVKIKSHKYVRAASLFEHLKGRFSKGAKKCNND